MFDLLCHIINLKGQTPQTALEDSVSIEENLSDLVVRMTQYAKTLN